MLNLELPLVHLCRQLTSFLVVLFIHNPAACRTMTPVSNFFMGLTRWLQAQPRCLLSSAPIVSSLSKGSALLGLLSGRFCSLRPCPSLRANLATDFHQSVVRAAQRSRLLLVPVLAQPPFPSLSPHSTLKRRPHKALRLVRFCVLGRIDRPEQSAANCLQISNFAAFNLF